MSLLSGLAWGAALLFGLIVAAAGIEAWIKRGRARPLAATRPTLAQGGAQKPSDTAAPLGMEAIDRDGFAQALRENDRLALQGRSESQHILGRRKSAPGDGTRRQT